MSSSPGPAPALAVRNLCFSIGGKAILEDVTFEVPQGAFVSIIGPNGAGKTTLLKCLNRIVTGMTGQIQVLGRSLSAYSQVELAVRLGYVPQAGHEAIPFSVFEFVMMGRYPHLSAFTSPTAADEASVDHALELAGAAELSDRDCGTLSGGERQKVLIAAALAQEARILLLDEPTTFLDPHHQAEILQVLSSLNRDSGVTMLAVTHDINAAALTSDTILALQQGRLVFRGTPDQLMTRETLTPLFGRVFPFVEHPVTGRRLILPEAVR
jgi:iron complex transport system ATP-binding protein